MARIAGLIHWRKMDQTRAEVVVGKTLFHMTGDSGNLISNDIGTLGFDKGSGGFSRLGDNILLLDGKLLEPTLIDKHGPDGEAGRILRRCLRIGFEATMRELEGDIAVVFLDASAGRVWFGRDRFGIKPFYFAKSSDGIAFSSLPASLVVNFNDISTRVNARYVSLVAGSHYRTFDNVTEESPFADVMQLPAAHTIMVMPEGFTKQKPYWILEPRTLDVADENILAEQYRELLLASVSKRLSISESQAFTLSGGMDSSSVICAAKELTGLTQSAYSTIYSDATFDERDDILDVVNSGLIDWTPIEVDNDIDLLQIVSRLVRTHNEPVATATWLSHDLLCAEASKRGHKSLFGGLGGDELNAGEYEYFPLLFADLQASGDLKTLNREITAWQQHHDHPIHRKTTAIAHQMIQRLTCRKTGRCLPDLERQKRYIRAINPDWFNLNSFRPIMDHPFESFLANRAYQDLTRETTPCCLRAEDRHCQAHGLEHYDPFIDKSLVEFMFSIPSNLKIREGVTKYLLRKATKDLVPEATRRRVKKTGWNAPAHIWFASEKGISALSDIISSSRFRNRGLYDLREVERLVDEHRTIVKENQHCENHMMFLWQLINVELWLSWIDSGVISRHE